MDLMPLISPSIPVDISENIAMLAGRKGFWRAPTRWPVAGSSVRDNGRDLPYPASRDEDIGSVS